MEFRQNKSLKQLTIRHHRGTRLSSCRVGQRKSTRNSPLKNQINNEANPIVCSFCCVEHDTQTEVEDHLLQCELRVKNCEDNIQSLNPEQPDLSEMASPQSNELNEEEKKKVEKRTNYCRLGEYEDIEEDIFLAYIE